MSPAAAFVCSPFVSSADDMPVVLHCRRIIPFQARQRIKALAICRFLRCRDVTCYNCSMLAWSVFSGHLKYLLTFVYMHACMLVSSSTWTPRHRDWFVNRKLESCIDICMIEVAFCRWSSGLKVRSFIVICNKILFKSCDNSLYCELLSTIDTVISWNG